MLGKIKLRKSIFSVANSVMQIVCIQAINVHE